MATKTFYVVRDMKHPLYRTRMLRAGDELELSGPDARLYRQLGVITEEKPRDTVTLKSGGTEFTGTLRDDGTATLRSKRVSTPRPTAAKPKTTRKRTAKRKTSK